MIKDIPDKAKDSEMTWHILRTHSGATKLTPPLDLQFLKKYIAVARKLRVIVGEAAQRHIHAYYTSMRNQSSDKPDLPMSITARQLETAERLTEAMAKMRMRETATEEDADLALALLDKSLHQIGYDAALGTLDIDVVLGEGGKRQKNDKDRVFDCIINNVDERTGYTWQKNVYVEMAKEGMDERKVDSLIMALSNEGAIIKNERNRSQWKKTR